MYMKPGLTETAVYLLAHEPGPESCLYRPAKPPLLFLLSEETVFWFVLFLSSVFSPYLVLSP